MSSRTKKLLELHGELEAMGSIPLLPADEYEEYATVCLDLLGVTEELVRHPESDDSPAETVDRMLEIAATLRRSGDDLTATEILLRAASLAEARDLGRMSSMAFNLAGINLYHLGQYDTAIEAFEHALQFLEDDEHGQVRSTIITMNWGNVLHDLKRFDEAERVYESLLEQVDAIPADVISRHAPFGADRLRGMLCNNIGANRTEWAQFESGVSIDIGPHLTIAERYLSRALASPLSPNEHVQSQTNFAHALILRGRPDEAEHHLRRLAQQCAADRDLMVQLPEIYRYSAEACAAQGDHGTALVDCYRSLESSLAVADRLQELRVVDTFVAVMRLSSSMLFDPSDPLARKAERLALEASGLVDRLVDFLERKDWYTGHNHSRAVQTISIRMGKALCAVEGEVGERARREIEWHSLGLGAALHDIGKLVVPWSLLNKLIPLNEGERSILRKHPESGQQILDQVGLPEIGAIIVEHHESPDGTGYPTGKRDSSMMGAIIAVADAFEAMTTVNRRYRRPKSFGEAVAEVTGLAGIQFDADVSRALAVSLSRS